MTHPDLARQAYHAYGHSTGFRTHQGQPMPAWEDLGEPIQHAWAAAAQAIAALVAPAPTPAIGHMVHVLVDPAHNNGSDVAPGIITRVWDGRMVNVRVLLDDSQTPACMTSIPLHPDRACLEAADPRPPGEAYGAFWPPRV